MRLLQKADVVLALGSRLGPFGTLPQYDIDYWPKTARVIQVDMDPRVLGLSNKVELALVADAKAFAAEVLREIKTLRKLEPNAERLGEVKRACETWSQELDDWSSTNSTPMHPRQFLNELSKVIPSDAIVSTDVGNNCSMSNAYLRFSGPRQFLPALSWGNCGFAYGAALGAKLGQPDRPVFALQGDGAWGISGLSEVMTAVREDIPVIAVVFQNYEWGAEKKNQIDYYGNRFVGTNLRGNPSFARLAEEMGAKGYRVEQASQVGDMVKDAIDSNRPVVI